MSGYPPGFNPREELKKKSETYANFIYYGLRFDKCSDFDPLPDGAERKMTTEWMGTPIWEMWALGRVYQFYIMQWALQQPDRPELQAVVRFVLRLSHLAELEGSSGGGVVEGLRKDLAQTSMSEADVATAVAAATSKLKQLHEASRRTPYDVHTTTQPLPPR
jgi:hypothetical protein